MSNPILLVQYWLMHVYGKLERLRGEDNLKKFQMKVISPDTVPEITEREKASAVGRIPIGKQSEPRVIRYGTRLYQLLDWYSLVCIYSHLLQVTYRIIICSILSIRYIRIRLMQLLHTKPKGSRGIFLCCCVLLRPRAQHI